MIGPALVTIGTIASFAFAFLFAAALAEYRASDPLEDNGHAVSDIYLIEAMRVSHYHGGVNHE